MRRRFMSLAAFLRLAGCAGAQPAGTTSAILPEEIVAKLQPGESDLAPDLYYVSDAAAGRSFDTVMIDPIIYFARSEEHTSELQSLMRISYDVFCLKHNTPTSHPRTTESTTNTL